MLRKPTKISLTLDFYYKLMATNRWRGLEALVMWSDSVTWLTKQGKDPVLLIKFYKVDDFLRWRDWALDTCFAYAYTVAADGLVEIQVPLQSFFRETVHPDKWRVSNQR